MSSNPICIYVLAHPDSRESVIKKLSKFSENNKNCRYSIFSDPTKCATKYQEFEPDIIFIDDLLFNKFATIFNEIKSKGMIFTFKRFVVFSLKDDFSADRLLELSLVGIRHNFWGEENFVSYLESISTQIFEFQKSRHKISVCLSGGGIDGYMYTLGVCRGLEDCLENFKFHDADIFCGVSSGAILSGCLAGGISTSELVQQVYKKHPKLKPITLSTLFDFAFKDSLRNTLNRKVPIGIFKGQKLKEFFVKQLANYNIADNWDAFKKEIYIFATNQDTGEAVVFGKDPWKKNIKISQAVRASTALPPFYLPENINGFWFTDGQLASSINFDIPIQAKSSLVFIVDPLVAFSTVQKGGVKNRGGYFTVLQAIKNLVHTRSEIGLQHARDKHPDVDFIKFEPTDKIMEIMSGNPMRIPIQTKLIEISARATRQQIHEQYEFFAHKFAKHGLTLKPQSEINLL